MQYEDAVRYRRDYERLRFRLPVEGPLTDEERDYVESLEFGLWKMWGWCPGDVLVPVSWELFFDEEAEREAESYDGPLTIAPLPPACPHCGGRPR